MATTAPVLYVTAEESSRQVAFRARRLGCVDDRLALLPESEVEAARAPSPGGCGPAW